MSVCSSERDEQREWERSCVIERERERDWEIVFEIENVCIEYRKKGCVWVRACVCVWTKLCLVFLLPWKYSSSTTDHNGLLLRPDGKSLLTAISQKNKLEKSKYWNMLSIFKFDIIRCLQSSFLLFLELIEYYMLLNYQWFEVRAVALLPFKETFYRESIIFQNLFVSLGK